MPNWDVKQFLQQLRGGFESGQEKRDEEKKLEQEAQKQEQKAQQEAEKARMLADKTAKAEQLHQFKTQKEQLNIVEKIIKMLGIGEPEKKPVKKADGITPTPKPKKDNKAIADAIAAGLQAYGMKSGYDNPLATASAYMADQAVENNLPDPYMPATMNIMETSGSKNMAQPNNYFNWGTNPKPDINTAIDRMVQGVGNTGEGGLYKDYLNSGEMSDFFKRYTPETDPNNPKLDTLLNTYTNIRNKYFPKK